MATGVGADGRVAESAGGGRGGERAGGTAPSADGGAVADDRPPQHHRPRTIVLLAVLLWVSVVIAGRIGFGVFTYGPMPVAGWALGAAVLVACLGVRAFMRALTSDAERAMAARRAWAPQTARERWLFVGAAVLAGIAEEAAYRGVGWQVLSWTLGDRSIVAMWILSVAFALAHRVQGWAAMVGIGVMAVLMHLLVWRTETLLVAIAVHVAYDVLVGLATPWRSAASHSAA